MFTLTLEEIFTMKALKDAFGEISSKAVGLDGVSLSLYKENLEENLQALQHELILNRFQPEPLKHIEVDKGDGTTRPIGIGALDDKIVQKTLAFSLGDYFETHFNDKSYGYRRKKSTLNAIARVKDFINRGQVYILRSDIENFFETINHERLLRILASKIEDARLLNIISLLLANGSFERYRYLDHAEGIHQGDPLSPLLSNIYLNELDWFLDEQDVDFVRYVDDLALFAHSPKALTKAQDLFLSYLESISLGTNTLKTKKLHVIKDGFTYLGVRFDGYDLSIAKEKFDASLYRLHELIKKTSPFEMVPTHLNQYIQGLQNYYLQLIDLKHPQMKLLEDAMLLALSSRVAKEKKRGSITTKGAFRKDLQEIDFPFDFSKTERKDFIERIIARAFEAFLATKSYKKAKKSAVKTKQKYAKKFATESTIFVNEPGVYLGVSKNTIILKHKGRVVYKVPKMQCERIIIANKGISLSSNVIALCAKLNIAIDFISLSNRVTAPYASIFTANHSYAKMTILQEALLQTPEALRLAKSFIKGKTKNQLNYLKLLQRHHGDLEKEIAQIERKMRRMPKLIDDVNVLMGYEGQVALLYWQALAKVVDTKVDFTHRHTYGATDLVNSALNYGYAILYGRVHFHAVKAGLSVNISFLHALDGNKPTLVYDLIEEFRAFVVDRTIFSMINNKEPLKLNDKQRLDLKSRQLIAKNVLEKLGSYTKHKKASKKIDNIIADQAYMLVRDIEGLTKYKPFVGKY